MMGTASQPSKKRLDLELSFYLVCCLGLFFIVAICGTAILAKQEYKKTSVIVKDRSNALLTEFKQHLPHSISEENANSIVATVAKIHDELLYLADAHETHHNLLIFVASLFTIFVLILFLFTSGWVQARLFGPISELVELSTHNDALTKLEAYKTRSIDIEMLRMFFSNMVLHRVEKEKKEKQLAELEKQIAIANVAAQVAHDIRSPLAALAVLESDLAMLSEDRRILIRSAINRIRDISNNLLEKKRSVAKVNSLTSANEEYSSHLIIALLEQMITEKRTQYRTKLNVEINSQFDSSSYGLFALIHPMEFKRIISNLINNAVEAMPKGGYVNVALSNQGQCIRITVSDNGCGIDEKVLPRLTQAGETHGKLHGSGLGLFHARKTLELWGGQLDIASTNNVGTAVTVILPKVSAPNWFVERIIIEPGMKIIIVDDDASIHQIWQGRIGILDKTVKAETHHLSTPHEFQLFLQKQPAIRERTLYLIDYEFIGHIENGLDLIEQGHIADSSILVTSRYEEEGVRLRAEQLKVKLIPKGMAAFVPIVLAQEKELYDAVLLDDDPLMHLVWERMAQTKNKHIVCFKTIKDLYDRLAKLDFSTPIYIDYDLKSSITGKQVSEDLNKKGFCNLYLATGYDPADIGAVHGVKAVVGKKPLWFG